ncbi:hypothetical protein C8R44DRAFT_822613 [Mycena epipterygia]|nr:hypothetical protein C8R44DRAFT_822613 [Mycena epipterygia]
MVDTARIQSRAQSMGEGKVPAILVGRKVCDPRPGHPTAHFGRKGSTSAHKARCERWRREAAKTA